MGAGTGVTREGAVTRFSGLHSHQLSTREHLLFHQPNHSIGCSSPGQEAFLAHGCGFLRPFFFLFT